MLVLHAAFAGPRTSTSPPPLTLTLCPPCPHALQYFANVFRSLRNVEMMQLYFAEQDNTHFLVVRFTSKNGE